MNVVKLKPRLISRCVPALLHLLLHEYTLSKDLRHEDRRIVKCLFCLESPSDIYKTVILSKHK